MQKISHDLLSSAAESLSSDGWGIQYQDQVRQVSFPEPSLVQLSELGFLKIRTYVPEIHLREIPGRIGIV